MYRIRFLTTAGWTADAACLLAKTENQAYELGGRIWAQSQWAKAQGRQSWILEYRVERI